MDGTQAGKAALDEADRSATEWNNDHAGIYAALREVDYHSHPALSASMLKVYAKSPMTFYRRFIARDLPQKETDEMRFGRLCHLEVFEPHKVADAYAVAPQVDRRTKDGKATWQAFVEASDGKEVVADDDMRLARVLSMAVRKHPEASMVLDAVGDVEKPIFWNDRIERRCRPDKVVPSMGVIADLKTVQDASPAAFARAAANFGWHLQAAWYRRALKATTGTEFRFVFIAVAKTEPHEVALYELHPDDLCASDAKNERFVDEIIGRTKANEWRADWQSGVIPVSLPRWAWSEVNQYEEVAGG